MAHLARLHGAQRDVGEELGGGGGDQVEAGLVEVSRLLADQVRVEVLEELVEAELAEALRRVPDSRGRPAWDRCRGAQLVLVCLANGGQEPFGFLDTRPHVSYIFGMLMANGI